jgi:branched-chain amino acid transport system ATP-binding protein
MVRAARIPRGAASTLRHAVAGDARLAAQAEDVLASVRTVRQNPGSSDEANLSYGERRALEIAVALRAAPPPSCAWTSRRRVWGATARSACSISIRRIRSHLTIVVIEHDMHFLFSLAERISVIHWGQVVARGTPQQLRSNEWVQRSNLGRFA